MDGLLLDTERLSMRFWIQAAEERGYEFPEYVFLGDDWTSR